MADRLPIVSIAGEKKELPAADTIAQSKINSLTSDLALKAPLASPNFTGDVTFDTDVLVVDSVNNRVGVGIPAPTRSLSVKVTGSANEGIYLVSTATGEWAKFAIDEEGVSNDFTLGVLINNALKFATNNTERMRIASDGKVGVGESSPLGNLHVKSADNGGTVDSGADELVIEGSGSSGATIMSGAAGVGNIYFGDSVGNAQGIIRYDHSTDSMVLGTNNTTKLTIESAGDLLSGTSNIQSLGNAGNLWKDIYLGGGLYVGGTAAANKLDDYEEGTWTPSLGGTTTYSIQQGSYTKVGDKVTAWFDVAVTTIGTGSTSQVSGLPVITIGSGPQGIAGSIGYFNAIATSIVSMFARVDPSATTIQLTCLTAAATVLTTAALFADGSRITGSITYKVA
jgi:hypothetical protein